MLELEHVVKHYRIGGGDPVRPIDGVSLSVAPGELVVIFGPSGSGKTTLLDLISGVRKPDAGKIVANGSSVTEMSRRQADNYRLHDLGIIDQADALFPRDRAIRNACLKLWLTNRRDAERVVLPLLLRLGLGDRLDQPTELLSMGERQRLAIARALALDPKIVLADEPTANLDKRRTGEVLALLRELCSERGTVTLIATHDEKAPDFADRAYQLEDGHLSLIRSDSETRSC